MNWIRLFFLTLLLKLFVYVISEEKYSEALFLRPLLEKKLLGHFEFTTSKPIAVEADLKEFLFFPKDFSFLVEKFHVKELHLTLTQGRWNYVHWGLPPSSQAGQGAELSVSFFQDKSTSFQNHHQDWKGLVYALSGMFCASLNFMDVDCSSSKAYSSGTVSDFLNGNETIRYGVLSGEAVCTENLTPFKKLLPFGFSSSEGLSSLLNPRVLYDSHFHSLGIHFKSMKSTEVGRHKTEQFRSFELKQTVTVVLNQEDIAISSGKHIKRNTLDSIFEIPSNTYRPLFSSVHQEPGSILKSKIYLHRFMDVKYTKPSGTPELTSSSQSSINEGHIHNGSYVEANTDEFVILSWNSSSMHQSSSIHQNSSSINNFNGDIDTGNPKILIKTQRYQVSYGTQSGKFIVEIENISGDDLMVVYFDQIPWFLKVRLHQMVISLKIGKIFFKDFSPVVIDHLGSSRVNRGGNNKVQMTPSRGRQPLQLRITQNIAKDGKLEITIPFQKMFLPIQEHSPDANRGFEVPPPFIVAWILSANASSAENDSFSNNLTNFVDYDDVLSWMYMVDRNSYWKEMKHRYYTDSLLVQLPTPDFSMPYNVITLSSTIISLFFVSMFNTIWYRKIKQPQPESSHSVNDNK